MKISILEIIKPTSGKLHSWVNTSIGKIRVPNNGLLMRKFLGETDIPKSVFPTNLGYKEQKETSEFFSI